MNYRFKNLVTHLKAIDLTSIFVVVIIIKIAAFPSVTLPWESLMGLVALGFKRFLEFKERGLSDTDQVRMKRLEAKVAELEGGESLRGLFGG